MKIEHIGLWVQDLPTIKNFYETYFNAHAGDLYENQTKHFQSYFLTFDDGARLEIMTDPDHHAAGLPSRGYAHLAVSLGSKAAVDDYAKRLQAAGYQVTSGPRTTGDGYYEAVVLDPEGNPIELTV